MTRLRALYLFCSTMCGVDALICELAWQFFLLTLLCGGFLLLGADVPGWFRDRAQ